MVLETLKTSIFALIGVALLAAAGALTLDAFQTDLIDDIPATTVTNESLGVQANGTILNVTNDRVQSITSVISDNQSVNTTLVLNRDYVTVNLASTTLRGGVQLINATYAGNTTYASYTFINEQGTVQTNVTAEGLLGVGNASDFLSTIGTIIGVAALVAVILGTFLLVRR